MVGTYLWLGKNQFIKKNLYCFFKQGTVDLIFKCMCISFRNLNLILIFHFTNFSNFFATKVMGSRNRPFKKNIREIFTGHH